MQAEYEQAAGHSREAGRQSKDGETLDAARPSDRRTLDGASGFRYTAVLRPDGGMADAAVSKTATERCAGSTPAPGTIFSIALQTAKHLPPIAAPLAGIRSTRRKRAGSAFSALRPAELAREGLAPTEGGCGDPAPGAIFSSPPREHEPPSRPLAGITPMEPRHFPTAFAIPALPGALAARLRPASVSRETPL